MIMTCDASEITQPIQFSSSLWISRSKATKGGAGPGRGTLSLIFPQNGVPPSLWGYRVASGVRMRSRVSRNKMYLAVLWICDRVFDAVSGNGICIS